MGECAPPRGTRRESSRCRKAYHLVMGFLFEVLIPVVLEFLIEVLARAFDVSPVGGSGAAGRPNRLF